MNPVLIYYMKLLRNDLRANSQSSSPDKEQTSPSRGFVPFHRQRDSMNRLIPCYSNQHNPRKEPFNKQRSQEAAAEDQQKNISAQKSNFSLKKFNDFFREEKVLLLCQTKRHKVNRKTLIQVLSESTARKKPSTSQANRTSISRPTAQPKTEDTLYKTQSAQIYRTTAQKSSKLKRSSSTVIPCRCSAASPKKIASPEDSPRKAVYYQPQVSVEDNLNKYPELKRFRRMQELNVKIHSDFEKKHGLFLDKMIKSKRLAFEVRANLDKMDHIYF